MNFLFIRMKPKNSHVSCDLRSLQITDYGTLFSFYERHYHLINGLVLQPLKFLSLKMQSSYTHRYLHTLSSRQLSLFRRLWDNYKVARHLEPLLASIPLKTSSSDSTSAGIPQQRLLIYVIHTKTVQKSKTHTHA